MVTVKQKHAQEIQLINALLLHCNKSVCYSVDACPLHDQSRRWPSDQIPSRRKTKIYKGTQNPIIWVYLHAFVLIETRHKICSTSETTFYLYYYFFLSCLAWKYVAVQKQNGLQKICHVESRTINNTNILFYI